MILAIQYDIRNCTSINIQFCGSSQQQNPGKLILNEFWWNHSMHKDSSSTVVPEEFAWSVNMYMGHVFEIKLS